MLRFIKHPNVIETMDLFLTQSKHLLIFMEKAKGDLLNYLKKQRKPISQPMAAKFYLQFGGALAFMHRKGLAHRDLKVN